MLLNQFPAKGIVTETITDRDRCRVKFRGVDWYAEIPPRLSQGLTFQIGDQVWVIGQKTCTTVFVSGTL